MVNCDSQKNLKGAFPRMRKSFSLSTAVSIFLLAGFVAGQPLGSGEIPVLSKLVGATIDIPEQEYYQVFSKVKGFLSAQFQETTTGFQAIIRTRKGWVTRSYAPREFYDLGLAIDLAGPIDPRVWDELSGKRVFEETVAEIGELPLGVKMIVYRESGKLSRGVYQGFRGHHFHLARRRGGVKKIPVEDVARIWYREEPVPDLQKDIRTYALMALAGMLLAEGWNRLFQAGDFDTRWRHRFTGGLLGLAVSPFVVHWFRVQRAPIHTVKFPRQTREKIDTYTFIAFN